MLSTITLSQFFSVPYLGLKYHLPMFQSPVWGGDKNTFGHLIGIFAHVTVILRKYEGSLCLGFIKTTECVLAYATAHQRQERKGSRVNAALSSPSHALPALVMCCNCAKPNDNKTFYVGSVFQLDAGHALLLPDLHYFAVTFPTRKIKQTERN